MMVALSLHSLRQAASMNANYLCIVNFSGGLASTVVIGVVYRRRWAICQPDRTGQGGSGG